MKLNISFLVLIRLSIFYLSFFNFYAENPKVFIKGHIDSEMRITATLLFSIENIVDSLSIYKFSSGIDSKQSPNLKIQDVLVNSKKASFTENEEWIMINSFGQSKTSQEIAITYTLNLNSINDWRSDYGYILFPGTYKNMCWYPDIYINGKRNFHKDFTVELSYPKDLTILTSGVLTDSDHTNSKFIKSIFKTKNVRYFGLNAGLKYKLKGIEEENVSVQLFYPESLENIYEEVAATALKVINWYSNTYGFFPKKSLGIVVGHPKWHGGFPSENMFYIHQGNLEKSFLQWITAHELGHYYWGLYTLSATEDELSPLMLSNGIWIDHLYLSDVYEKPISQIWNQFTPQAAMLEKYLATYLSNQEQEIGFTQPEQNFGFDYNSNIVHAKAAIGMYLVSQTIGINVFLELQKEILETYKGRPFGIKDFREILEERGYATSSAFIEDWYKDHAFIEYGIFKLTVKKNENKWQYDFEIRKKGTIDFPVDIQIQDILGNVYNLKSDGHSKVQNFRGYTESEPLNFLLDPNGKLPMWNSDNEYVQKAYIFALYRAGKLKIANRLAKDYLKNNPDDDRMNLYYNTYKY